MIQYSLLTSRHFPADLTCSVFTSHTGTQAPGGVGSGGDGHAPEKWVGELSAGLLKTQLAADLQPCAQRNICLLATTHKVVVGGGGIATSEFLRCASIGLATLNYTLSLAPRTQLPCESASS